MDRRNWYFDRFVTSSDLLDLEEDIETADKRIVENATDYGIISGLVASAASGKYIGISSGKAFDDLGQWIEASGQSIDCTLDKEGNSTTPTTGWRYFTIFIYFAWKESTPMVDGFGHIVNWNKDEYYVFKIVNGTAAPTAEEAVVPDDPIGHGLAICDVLVQAGQVEFEDDDISDSRKRDLLTIRQHRDDYDNPHLVTKEQLDLKFGHYVDSSGINSDMVDDLHASAFALTADLSGHISQNTPVHGMKSGHFEDSSGINADRLDGYHAKDFLGGGHIPGPNGWIPGTPGGGITTIIEGRTIIIQYPSIGTATDGDPKKIAEVPRFMVVVPSENGPVPNVDVGGILLTALIMATPLNGATQIIGSFQIRAFGGVLIQEESFSIALGVNTGGYRLGPYVLDPNDYGLNDPYLVSIWAGTDVGTATIDDWTMQSQTRRGTGDGNTDEWRPIWEDTFVATATDNLLNGLDFDLILTVSETSDPMSNAKIRVRTYPTGGTAEAGVSIETGEVQDLLAIAPSQSYRTQYSMALTGASYTAGERYWFVLEAYVPSTEDGSCDLRAGSYHLRECPVVIV